MRQFLPHYTTTAGPHSGFGELDGMVGTLAILLLTATPADVNLTALMAQVDPARLRATVERLVEFPTRNTLSPIHREAAAWVAEEYRKLPGMEVELMEYDLPRGGRTPDGGSALQVIARLPGRTDRMIMLGAHLDSLNLRGDPRTVVAPGANDDASGVALCLEVARLLVGRAWNQTLVFVAFTGEEQGLLGARALARRARTEGWAIEAMLNSDTVGSSRNLIGQEDTGRVRVFSEEGEDHASRELARFIEWQVRQTMEDFRIKLVFRRDRFGRGGDHTPFVEQGYSGVRFIEVYEEFAHQHTPDDLVEHMDFDYLAQVTRAKLTATVALANAGPSPTQVRIDRRQGHDTTVTWRGEEGIEYVIYWRDTASGIWEAARPVGTVNRVTVERVNKDDHIFAVGAVGGIPVEAR